MGENLEEVCVVEKLFIKLKVRKCKLLKAKFKPSEVIRWEVDPCKICMYWQLEGRE